MSRLLLLLYAEGTLMAAVHVRLPKACSLVNLPCMQRYRPFPALHGWHGLDSAACVRDASAPDARGMPRCCTGAMPVPEGTPPPGQRTLAEVLDMKAFGNP